MQVPSHARKVIITAGLFTLWLGGAGMTATPITVKSSHNILDAADTERREFGKLVYVSGIAMRSDHPDFGGMSGLQVSADGKQILAITDTGQWISADLIFDKGRLSGLANVEIDPLSGLGGKPLGGKHDSDAESLSAERPGQLDGPQFVSFERNHRVLYYPNGLAGGNPVQMPMPDELAQVPANDGLEAFERRPDGAFIALTEGLFDEAGHHKGWLIGARGAQTLRLRRQSIFTPTDLELLPNGDLLILERRYTVMGGPGMQIRRVSRDSIKPGALLDGEVLINLSAKHGIDNMEGLAAHQNAMGEIIVYVLSDNNFNTLQKNLLLMFKLRAP